MSERHLVEFIDQAAVDLSESLQKTLRRELLAVFRERKPHAVTVSRCFAGYAGVSADKVILGVELRLPTGFETHIVKVGSVKEVADDYNGWQQCCGGRDIASRILLPVQKKDLGKGRVAVYYRDAYTLYGPNRANNRPEWLETIVRWSVLDDEPDPLSVERALVHIYTDLARWFYYGSEEHPDRALALYRQHLKHSLHNWLKESADADQQEQAQRRWDIRQDAIWLFSGADSPDGERDAEYLDPCDYVAWALAGGTVPATLVGRSHGDLHARNILVAVQRGEAEYPVVIDYGAMACDNILVWDFVKLETEIKNDLLPRLFIDAQARKALTGSDGAPPAEKRSHRAARLQFFFRFEKLLAQRTNLIEGRADASSRQPPSGRAATLYAKVDRLLAVLLRIRQEAALWLGYEPGRQHRWRDEYYFALACYGLVHARQEWDYEPRHTECALLSAGVAAANMHRARAAIRDLVSKNEVCPSYPSYRVPLALAHSRWQAGRVAEALAIVEHVLSAGGETARPNFHHAVPLLAEQALLLAEKGDHLRAEALLRPLREGCRLFRDHETLSRIGRAYKESGDRLWAAHAVPFDQLDDLPARQMYRHALGAYQEAFELGSNYYPGINAASLALLAGNADLAQDLARRVLATCGAMSQSLVGEEAVWVFATEGEASLLLGLESAKTFYATALDWLDPVRAKLAQSMYSQLCRLWQALGSEAVEPVIREFEQREVWKRMHAGPLGDCGGRSRPR
jgi:hypothetical protein